MVPVIGYIRVSTWREEAISDEIQKAAITEAAMRSGRHVVRWVIDLDATGRNFKRRIMEAIAAVEEREVNEIWVWKFSRFGRSRHGVAINLARVEHVGGQLVSATEDVDATTATGRFARGMLFEVAAFESDRAGEQWKETHELRRAAGVPATGGKRPGYIWHPRRIPDPRGGWTTQDEAYVADPQTAEHMADGYHDYVAGRAGYAKLAVRFNDAGFLNTRGAPWNSNGVRGAFNSGFSAGLLYVHRRDVPCGDLGKCKRWVDHWTHLAAEHEAIIDDEDWDAYLDRKTNTVTPGWSHTPAFPLTGLTRCGVCGSAAGAGQSGRGATPGYAFRCRAVKTGKVQHASIFVVRAKVEDAVRGWLLRQQQRIDDIAAGRVVAPAEPAPDRSTEIERDRLVREIGRLSAALDRATRSHVLGDIPRDQYLRTRDSLTEEKAAKERQLSTLLPVSAGPTPPAPRHEEILAGLADEWDLQPVDRLRHLLTQVIRRIELHPDAVILFPAWAPDAGEQLLG